MFMSGHQNARGDSNVKTDKESFEKKENSECLGRRVTSKFHSGIN
jgi:hypothetical protein